MPLLRMIKRLVKFLNFRFRMNKLQMFYPL